MTSSTFTGNMARLLAAQRAVLRKKITEARNKGLEWEPAIAREFQVLSKVANQDSLAGIAAKYVAAIRNPAALPALESAIAAAPEQIRQLIPQPRRVLERKQALDVELQKATEALP